MDSFILSNSYFTFLKFSFTISICILIKTITNKNNDWKGLECDILEKNKKPTNSLMSLQ